MPRSETGAKRPPVNAANLAAAVAAVTRNDEGRMSLREAAKVFHVTSVTLFRQVRKHKAKGTANFQYESNMDVKRVFSRHEEEELVNYIVKVARMHYGLTKKGVRKLAFGYAKANNKKVPDSWDKNEIAGEEWMRLFMKRHGHLLSIRKPEATSLARATSFNKTNYDKFMTNLEDIHRRFGPIPPERIWNMDESGCTTVQAPPKIVAPKGVKQLGSTTSAERGQLVTIICAISALGNHMPPMLIFPRVNFKDYMLTGAPPGALGSANPSGWSNEEQFIKFLDHFIKHAKPTKEDPILLILDNHESHCSSQAVEMASKNGIKMLTFPPHTSNRLQPLDLTIFGPFKTYYNQALDAWHLNNPGKTFGIYNVAEAVGVAFPRAFTPHNICSGFRHPGIYPINRAAFCDDDFAPAAVTDRPNPEVTSSETTSVYDSSPAAINPPPLQAVQTSSLDRRPSLEMASRPSSSGTQRMWTPEDIQPYPKAPPRKGTIRKNRAGTTRILTDTPVKEELKQKQKKKEDRENQKTLKKETAKKKKKIAKRTLFESSDEDTDDPPYQDESDVEGKTYEELFSSSLEDEENEIQPPLADSLSNGAYVLVKFLGKRDIIYYVASITKKLSPREFEVSYLRKKGNKFFVYPPVPDTATVDVVDIVAVLPPPAGEGSERARDAKSFKFPFYKYNVN